MVSFLGGSLDPFSRGLITFLLHSRYLSLSQSINTHNSLLFAEFSCLSIEHISALPDVIHVLAVDNPLIYHGIYPPIQRE